MAASGCCLAMQGLLGGVDDLELQLSELSWRSTPALLGTCCCSPQLVPWSCTAGLLAPKQGCRVPPHFINQHVHAVNSPMRACRAAPRVQVLSYNDRLPGMDVCVKHMRTESLPDCVFPAGRPTGPAAAPSGSLQPPSHPLPAPANPPDAPLAAPHAKRPAGMPLLVLPLGQVPAAWPCPHYNPKAVQPRAESVLARDAMLVHHCVASSAKHALLLWNATLALAASMCRSRGSICDGLIRLVPMFLHAGQGQPASLHVHAGAVSRHKLSCDIAASRRQFPATQSI